MGESAIPITQDKLANFQAARWFGASINKFVEVAIEPSHTWLRMAGEYNRLEVAYDTDGPTHPLGKIASNLYRIADVGLSREGQQVVLFTDANPFMIGQEILFWEVPIDRIYVPQEEDTASTQSRMGVSLSTGLASA